MSWSAAGAVADAVARARYMEKQMMARRALRVHMKRSGEEGREWSEEAEYADFECFTLCLQCGYLTSEPSGPCPGCGLQRWTDLRSVSSAEAVRQMERRDRMTTPAFILTRANYTAIGAAVITLGVWAAIQMRDPDALLMDNILFGLLPAAVAAVVGYFVARISFSAWAFYRRPTFPARWHLPLPMPKMSGRPAQVLQGVPVAQGELLRAPVSDRPCLGYEVSVHFDAPGDKRPRMWILEEEHTVAFAVGDQIVEADRATLKLPTELVGEEDVGLDETGVARFLRKRGLFASEGLYAVFESIIEPDQPYRVELYDKPPGAAAVVRPAK